MANTSYYNVQPYLTISEAINLTGVYGGGEGVGMGAIHFFAFNFAPTGTALLNGQFLPINQNQALYSILGTTYGGNGVTTFELPDLRGRLAVGSDGASNVLGLKFGAESGILTTASLDAYFGGSAPNSNAQPSLVITPLINVQGIYGGGINPVGGVWEFAGSTIPVGTLPCDGRLLNISQNMALYSLLGTTYGGDGITTFALPDLRGRTIVGSGTLDGTTYVEGAVLGDNGFVVGKDNMPTGMGHAGNAVDNMQPSLVMDYYISLYGVFPSTSGGGPGDTYIGEIMAYAGNATSLEDSGWAKCDGSLLQISDNTALYSLIGTTYGGDGITTFALPNLSGRSIMNQGTGGGLSPHTLGETGGSAGTTLTLNNIPAVVVHDDNNGHSISGANQADQLYGNGGNDTLLGLAGNDTLNGGAGDDRLDGGIGADTMAGGAGNDTYVVDNIGDVVTEGGNQGIDTVETWINNYSIKGGVDNLTLMGTVTKGNGNALDNVITGNDVGNTLNGGLGNDTLIGGLGNDTYIVDNPLDTIVELSGQGTDTVLTSGDYTLAAGVSVEVLKAAAVGGTTALTLTGNEFGQTITGNAGANVINGLDGDDNLQGLGGNDTLNGGIGNDILNGGAGSDTMTGGIGDDSYYVDAAGDVVNESAGEGTDTILATVNYTLAADCNVELLRVSGGSDFLTGLQLTGNDLGQSIFGGGGNDVLTGGAAADNLTGLEGADTLKGNAGNDTIRGGAGNDSLYGGDDNDTLWGGTGNDILDGGNGVDTAAYGDATSAVTVDLRISGTQNTHGGGIDTLVDIERVSGSAFGDTLLGNADANLLIGNAGDDFLQGGGGRDTLQGGAGADTFSLNLAAGLADSDKISDFTSGTDHIQLAHFYYDQIATGALTANAFYAGASAHDADDRIIYDSASGNLYYDPDGTGAAAQQVFAQVNPGTTVVYTDFLVA